MNKLRLSHTKVSTFQHCRQRYVWTYLENLSPKEKAMPLQVGDVVHKLHHLWTINQLTPEVIETLNERVLKLYPEDSEELSIDVAVQAANLIRGYLKKYGEDDPLTFIPGETTLDVEFENYILTGKIDCWVRPRDGRLWRVEHKTAAKMDSHYLAGLKGGLQGAIYDFLSEHLFNEKVSGTIYNLLVKTKIPDYHRVYTKCDRSTIDRMLKTIEGVYKDIKGGNFYPSSLCYGYARECDYKLLCNHDSKEEREAFYSKRKEVTQDDGENKAEGK